MTLTFLLSLIDKPVVGGVVSFFVVLLWPTPTATDEQEMIGMNIGYETAPITLNPSQSEVFRPAIDVLPSRPKPVNLPSPSKVTIDIDHIISGHGSGGNRGGPNKSRFPDSITAATLAKAIMDAYENCSKIQTQGVRIQLIGPGDGYDIVMWLNRLTKTIESAWPVFWRYRQY